MSGSGPPLRIMHICWLKPGITSGYRTRVIEETRLLVELGHRVDLAVFSLATGESGNQWAEAFADSLQQQTGADVHVLPTAHFFDLSATDAFNREICDPLVRLVNERSIQVVHGQAMYAAGVGLRVAGQIPDLKTVFDCHGILPEETAMQGRAEARVRALEQFERNLLANVDLTVLVSEKMGDHFHAKYGIRPNRQVLVPCCVDLAKFATNDAERRRIREDLGLHDSIVIVYAGTLAVWQWPAAMFNLFARIHRRLPAARLLLLVPESDHPVALELLRETGVPPAACILREVPNTEIGPVLAAGDVGLLLRQDHPVNRVSSPTKFGEYMAAGVPSITTTAVGDFSSWIEEGQVGLLIAASDNVAPQEDIDRVCAFLLHVRDNRQTFRTRCRELALERLNWHDRIQNLSRAYHELLGTEGPSIASHGSGSPSRKTGQPTGRPLRVLFNGHDLKFARRIIEHFSASPGYEVQVDQWKGWTSFDAARSEKLLRWADVIFCEWCLGSARWYSQHKRPGQRLFVRLHHQEMQLPYRFQLEWPNVDAIIFINYQHYASFIAEQPEHREKAVLIFNVIDCGDFDREKLPGAEFNLGFIGINPLRKRPDLALEILSRLREYDSRYTLSFKTAMPWEYVWLWERPQEREFYTRFFESIESSPHRDALVFDPHGDDMPDWYSKIGFILSTSDHEGSHQAVAEGMAAGGIPIIRNWDGATPLYPAEFVFSGVQEAVDLIQRFSKPDTRSRLQSEVRAYARRYFDLPVIMRHFEALFAGEEIPEPIMNGLTSCAVGSSSASHQHSDGVSEWSQR